MNKKLDAYFTSLGMQVNKNSAYGIVNGFELNVSITNFDNVSPFKLHISFYADSIKKQNVICTMKNAGLVKGGIINETPYGIAIGMHFMTVNGLLAKLPGFFDTTFNAIRQEGGLGEGFCPVCGEQKDGSSMRSCNVDGFTITIDNDCFSKINDRIAQENRDFANAPNNYLRGFLGALVGGAVGIVVAIILYMFNFVAAFSAIVAMMLGAFLYQKFGGKPNKMMIVIVSLTTLVCMACAVPIIYITMSGIAAAEVGFEGTAMDAFLYLMQDKEFAQSFYLDMVLLMAFAVIGIVVQIFVYIKQIKRPKNLQ